MQGKVKISICFPPAVLNHWNIEWVSEFGLINVALVEVVTYRQKCKYAKEKTRPVENNTIDNDLWTKVDFVSVTLISLKPPRTKFTVRCLNKWLDLSELQSTYFPWMKWKHQVLSFFQNKLISCDTFSDPMSLACLLCHLGLFGLVSW